MKIFSRILVAAIAMAGFAQANAASIDIETCNATAGATDWGASGQWDTNGTGGIQAGDNKCWTTDATNNIGDQTNIQNTTGTSPLSLIAKLETDSGSSITSGGVTISVTSEDGNKAQTATITTDADCSGAGSCFLVVKDGNSADPAQYLLDLSGLDLSGGLTLTNIFAEFSCTSSPSGNCNGAISNVAFWAGEGTGVPEPMTLLLLGAGLVGFGVRRKLLA